MRSMFLWVVLFALLALASGQESPSGEQPVPMPVPVPVPGAFESADATAPGAPAVVAAVDTPSVAPVTVVSPAPNGTVVLPGAAPIVPNIPRANATISGSGAGMMLPPIGASSQAMDPGAKVKPAPEGGSKNSSNSTTKTPSPSKKSGVSTVAVTTLPFIVAGSVVVLAMW